MLKWLEYLDSRTDLILSLHWFWINEIQFRAALMQNFSCLKMDKILPQNSTFRNFEVNNLLGRECKTYSAVQQTFSCLVAWSCSFVPNSHSSINLQSDWESSRLICICELVLSCLGRSSLTVLMLVVHIYFRSMISSPAENSHHVCLVSSPLYIQKRKLSTSASR